MKPILVIAILMSCIYSFAQQPAGNRINKIATQEKEKYNINVKPLSLASANFNVYYYRCNWNINPAQRYISGSVTSYFKMTVASNQIIYDFTNALTVDRVIFRKNPVTFSQASNKTLSINFTFFIGADKKDSVTIYYHGVPPSSGDFTGGFTQTTHSGTPIIWTLSEPYGAAGWWPCRNGLDDKADSIDVYITHPSQYNASSNGILVSRVTNGSSATSHYKHRYPVASYLVAIAVTNYSVFTNNVQINGKTLPVIQYVYPEDLSSFQSNTPVLLNAIKLYSEYFSNYPFLNERYGQTEFSWGGGMEHQTNSFVTNAGTHLITHELGHQWFGDEVTCASWHDVWLNEGFATWLADMFYTEKIDTLYYKTYVQQDLDYIVSQPGGSVWVDDTTNVNRIFDSRLTYDKGAFLLRMLRWTLGDKVFFKGINNYLTDAKLSYDFARTKDLQRNLEEASGEGLNYFFKQWFYGQGYPSFTVKWKDSSNGKLYFTVKQKTSMPSSVDFFRVLLPVEVSNGKKSETIALNCTTNNQSFVVDAPNFTVTKVKIDPDAYLISANNKVARMQSLQEEAIPVSSIKILVSPNPVQSTATINLENMQGQIRLQLFDNAENIVWKKETNTKEKFMQVQIPFASITSGIYRLVVTDNSGVQQSVTIVK